MKFTSTDSSVKESVPYGTYYAVQCSIVSVPVIGVFTCSFFTFLHINTFINVTLQSSSPLIVMVQF